LRIDQSNHRSEIDGNRPINYPIARFPNHPIQPRIIPLARRRRISQNRLMGVVLTPIIQKDTLSLDDLRGKRLAVDGQGELYQFLALIRLRDGTPLRDSKGRITSHLSGLFYRTTRLIADYRLQLAFVFDGAPPVLKAKEIERRRAIRQRYEDEREAALSAGDTATAYSKATMTSRLTREMVNEARELLRLMGIPTVQAPSEGEAQAARMARDGAVWAAGSKDYDSLLFGAPRLLRFLTISGREFLPSQGTFRPIVPELIDGDAFFSALSIDRAQLVDLAILVGTDFNDGIKGVGPKKALKLVQQYGRIEAMPGDIREAVGDVDDVRRIFLDPQTTGDYDVTPREPDLPAIADFLCGEREFARIAWQRRSTVRFGSGRSGDALHSRHARFSSRQVVVHAARRRAGGSAGRPRSGTTARRYAADRQGRAGQQRRQSLSRDP
jgi:flap endonuclease-1